MHTGHTALLLLAAHAHLHLYAHSRPHPRPVVGSSTARHFVAATFEPQRRARYSLLCMCVCYWCVCNGRHKLTNNFFTFHLVCAHCLPFFVAFFCCSFCCYCCCRPPSPPPLLPLLRLYVHRACACACVCALVYEHFLFLLSRIFMQSAALHFLTLQSVAFRVPLCTVLSVCALCLCVCFVCVCNASLRCVVQLH